MFPFEWEPHQQPITTSTTPQVPIQSPTNDGPHHPVTRSPAGISDLLYGKGSLNGVEQTASTGLSRSPEPADCRLNPTILSQRLTREPSSPSPFLCAQQTRMIASWTGTLSIDISILLYLPGQDRTHWNIRDTENDKQDFLNLNRTPPQRHRCPT